MRSNNLLNQFRQRGITIRLEGSKIKLSSTEHFTEKVRYWLIKHQSCLCNLLQKEQYLKKLIENVSRHANGTNEDIEEMFDYAVNHIGLDIAISSYQVTVQCQARIVSLGYNKTAFCKTYSVRHRKPL